MTAGKRHSRRNYTCDKWQKAGKGTARLGKQAPYKAEYARAVGVRRKIRMREPDHIIKGPEHPNVPCQGRSKFTVKGTVDC